MGEGSTECPVPEREAREVGFKPLTRASPGPREYWAGCGRPHEDRDRERMDRSRSALVVLESMFFWSPEKKTEIAGGGTNNTGKRKCHRL